MTLSGSSTSRLPGCSIWSIYWCTHRRLDPSAVTLYIPQPMKYTASPAPTTEPDNCPDTQSCANRPSQTWILASKTAQSTLKIYKSREVGSMAQIPSPAICGPGSRPLAMGLLWKHFWKRISPDGLGGHYPPTSTMGAISLRGSSLRSFGNKG